MLPLLAVLLFTPASAFYKAEAERGCDGTCQSSASMHALVAHLRSELKIQERKLAESDCTVCWSSPCQNGGSCLPVNATTYRCECPEDYAGPNCEQHVQCGPHTCGVNAVCFVADHRTNCACRTGYSGNPYTGCLAKVKSACLSGDPHYRTFDGTGYNFQGTCPYVFSQPCTMLGGVYQDYRVKAKNVLLPTTNEVSTIEESETEMYGIKIHVAKVKNTFKVYVDGILTALPYYYPSKQEWNVRITLQSGTVYITNDQLVSVRHSATSLCVDVPDVPEFQGNGTLCGLAGDISGSCSDDLRTPSGKYLPVENCTANEKDGAAFGDSWVITDDFDTVNNPDEACLSGWIIANQTNECNFTTTSPLCETIYEAGKGQGPFAVCQAMGQELIQYAYDACLYDTCHDSGLKCSVLAAFARQCQAELPGTTLDWRDTAGCPITCPVHSHYESCAGACQPSCAQHDFNNTCVGGCQESCVCDFGYVIDNSASAAQLEGVVCIPIEDCGCNDPFGNPHAADEPWITDNCTLSNVCINGTYSSSSNACSDNGYCSVDQGIMQCDCDPGYEGDGYHCQDIDECLDPTTCMAGAGHGVCENLPGSHKCVCNSYYSGDNCEKFTPARHCADLFVFHNATEDGVYTIYPPYEYAGRPAFTPLKVYCDQTTQGGGWTLMGNAKKDINANKTMQEYVEGYGSQEDEDLWLGLDVIHGMTNDDNTSMRVELFRCARNGLQNLSTYCTYPEFVVRPGRQGYAVFIPQQCSGSEWNFFDGWARWDLSRDGPLFSAFDNDLSKCNCSASFRNTGWWYDTTSRCGAANLNGIRYACGQEPDEDEIQSYLWWAGSPLSAAEMFLRPAGFPNYDVKPPTVAPPTEITIKPTEASSSTTRVTEETAEPVGSTTVEEVKTTESVEPETKEPTEEPQTEGPGDFSTSQRITQATNAPETDEPSTETETKTTASETMTSTDQPETVEPSSSGQPETHSTEEAITSTSDQPQTDEPTTEEPIETDLPASPSSLIPQTGSPTDQTETPESSTSKTSETDSPDQSTTSSTSSSSNQPETEEPSTSGSIETEQPEIVTTLEPEYETTTIKLETDAPVTDATVVTEEPDVVTTSSPSVSTGQPSSTTSEPVETEEPELHSTEDSSSTTTNQPQTDEPATDVTSETDAPAHSTTPSSSSHQPETEEPSTSEPIETDLPEIVTTAGPALETSTIELETDAPSTDATAETHGPIVTSEAPAPGTSTVRPEPTTSFPVETDEPEVHSTEDSVTKTERPQTNEPVSDVTSETDAPATSSKGPEATTDQTKSSSSSTKGPFETDAPEVETTKQTSEPDTEGPETEEPTTDGPVTDPPQSGTSQQPIEPSKSTEQPQPTTKESVETETPVTDSNQPSSTRSPGTVEPETSETQDSDESSSTVKSIQTEEPQPTRSSISTLRTNEPSVEPTSFVTENPPLASTVAAGTTGRTSRPETDAPETESTGRPASTSGPEEPETKAPVEETDGPSTVGSTERTSTTTSSSAAETASTAQDAISSQRTSANPATEEFRTTEIEAETTTDGGARNPLADETQAPASQSSVAFISTTEESSSTSTTSEVRTSRATRVSSTKAPETTSSLTSRPSTSSSTHKPHKTTTTKKPRPTKPTRTTTTPSRWTWPTFKPWWPIPTTRRPHHG